MCLLTDHAVFVVSHLFESLWSDVFFQFQHKYIYPVLHELVSHKYGNKYSGQIHH